MTAVAAYIAELDRIFRRVDATEHSYRPALKKLLESHAGNIEATNEPQRIAGNAPDYVVRRNATIIGHVEAKDIGEPLEKLLKSPQLKRYREALPNLMFTDYLDFIWIEDGEAKLRVSLGAQHARGIVAAADADARWKDLSMAFFNAVTPTVRTPKQLASLLAAQTRLLRDATVATLNHEGDTGALAAQHRAFRELLMPELDAEEFADMFAQTVAYGLFTARVFDKTPLDFSLREAETLIPKASPFLRQLFRFIAFDLSDGVRWIAESIVDVLLHADLDKVLHRQSRKRGFTDPIFHFYETFLAEYDAGLREKRGVYYTPEPVVDFIVRGVEHLLKTQFGRAAGLADPDTVILDPATGTATFLREVIDRIYRHQVDAGLQGAWPEYVRKHLLPRIFGFELMMAPYTVAHLKLALELTDRGFTFADGDRLNVFLTNTLDRIQGKTGELMAQWLTAESEGAERVKDKVPVEVVLGNPPYSGHSTNKGAWIVQLLDDYKKGVPELKKPGQAKWLSDDYVKFIRFAHWRIAHTGHGIVGYIANHSWLDNPTFRGMRAALRRDFDDIYILDLHGNSKKKEKTPDAHAAHGDDKNVFDIQQGVAILFLLRKPGAHVRKAVVHHAELWGSRDSKYQRLEDMAFEATPWQRLDLVEPLIPFMPMDIASLDEYRRGWSVPAIFSLNGDPAPGIVTTQDDFAISWAADEAKQKVDALLATKSEDDARKLFKLCSQDQWQYDRAKRELADGAWRERVVPILYRPFDTRWTIYDRNVAVHRRERVMNQLLEEGKNAALICPRQVKEDWGIFCSSTTGAHKTCSAYDINYYFPLWLLPEHDTLDPAKNVRHPNLDPRYLKALADALGVGVTDPFGMPAGVTPEDVFHFIYAVLHAPTYRARYAEYLRSDFPRIPLPPDLALFSALAALGAQLVALHLLRDPALAQGGPAYPVSGDHLVEKIRYEPALTPTPLPGVEGLKGGRVWINARQYFESVDADTWAFKVGGYQVLEKWLKDRKGRQLGIDDITHYRKIVLALAATRTLMEQIDQVALPLFPVVAAIKETDA